MQQQNYQNMSDVKICQRSDFLRFLFIEDSLKIEMALEVVFGPHLLQNFLMKVFLL